jgi:Xaa-Pro aminopeptidase
MTIRIVQMRRAALALVLLFLSTATLSAARIFDKAEYAARRQKLYEKIPDGAAVLFGAQTIPSYFLYGQSNDFLYLTGVELPNAAVILDGTRKSATLFFTATEDQALGEGIPAELVRNPQGFTGIERIMPIEALTQQIAMIAQRSPVLYTPFRPEELYREASMEKARTLLQNMTLNTWDGRVIREMQFVKILRDRFPGLEVKDCSALIWELRSIKSPAEIEFLRRTGTIGVKAHIAIMQACRPGMMEHELSAVFNYVCEKEGAQESAYGVIISSGPNHRFVHYAKHDRRLEDGDFLVVDAAPDLDYYDIDITTSFPANGKFTPRQKEVYEASRAVHEACLKVYRPGLTLEQCQAEVDEILKKQGFDLNKDYFKRMRGGFGHFVGMATHDVGGSPRVLKPGMVFANEPYMFWPNENLGVRVEDTVLITGNGCENLTAGIPRTIAEIEALMKKDGIPQVLKKAGIY